MRRLVKKITSVEQYEKMQGVYLRVMMSVFALRRRLYESFGSFKYSKMALSDLDDKLAPFLNFKGGVFIEAGANDGVSQSNTYYLEKARGWRGVLVEPVPRLFEKCKNNRKKSVVYNCALVSPEEEGDIVNICESGDRGLLSKISENNNRLDGVVTAVCGRTLTSVLSEVRLERIDFFSLDVEGYELSVLKGFDFSKVTPRFILVETAQVENVDQCLRHDYDRIAQLTFHDYMYQLKLGHEACSQKSLPVSQPI